MDRVSAMSRNSMVMSMGVAAAVPVLLMALAENMTTSTMALWVVASLVGGWAFGGLMHGRSRRNADHGLIAFAQVIERVAEGNLQDRLDTSGMDDIDAESQMLKRLGSAINRMLDRLHAVTVEISGALRQIDNDTAEILSATGRQITMASEQDKVVTETTATVNEVRATVTETAERVQSVAETAQVSVNISRAGTEAVQETVSGMELIRRRVEDIADNILVLSEHTQQIGEIIATVNNLADQSRMLALNASVEAARAGEEGKGFAVVALEVRNLADQNRDATVQVREILGEIQRATNSAVMVTEEGSKGVDHGQVLVNRAGDAIRDLAHAIEEAALAAMQIAASTRQQTIGMDQLTQAMRTIKHATAETVTSTMQVEASVQRLRKVADRVNEVMAGLKI
jgi:methyl-accepting chemotaxis protein